MTTGGEYKNNKNKKDLRPPWKLNIYWQRQMKVQVDSFGQMSFLRYKKLTIFNKEKLSEKLITNAETKIKIKS